MHRISIALAIAMTVPPAAFANGDDLPPQLVGPDWQVLQIGDEDLPEDVEVTLTMGEDGRLAGAGGCNRYFAGYEVTDGTISVAEIASTMMACEESRMALERRYFDALSRVETYAFDEDGLLVLSDADGVAITARAGDAEED